MGRTSSWADDQLALIDDLRKWEKEQPEEESSSGDDEAILYEWRISDEHEYGSSAGDREAA